MLPDWLGLDTHIFLLLCQRNDGTVRMSHVDYIACSARDLNPRPLTYKQPSSWCTAPSQESLLEKLITITGAATGNQTQVS